jgi:hypothetical protein
LPWRVSVDGGRNPADLFGVRVGEKGDKTGFPAVEVFVEDALLQGIKAASAKAALVRVGASLPHRGCRPLMSQASYRDVRKRPARY